MTTTLLLTAIAVVLLARRKHKSKAANRLPLRLIHENKRRISTCPFDDYRDSEAWKIYQASQRLEKL